MEGDEVIDLPSNEELACPVPESKGILLWDYDVITWERGLSTDPEYRALINIKNDNPSKEEVQVPFRFRGENDHSLWTRAQRSLNRLKGVDLQEGLIGFMKYFGPDQHCLDWTPKSSIQFFPALKVEVRPTPLNFASVKPLACKFLVALGLVVEIWWELGWSHCDPAVALFEPRVLAMTHDDILGASAMARFRHAVVWKLFGSSKVFWSKLECMFLSSLEYAFVWPQGEESNITVSAIRDYLLSQPTHDKTLIDMTYALECLVGASPNFAAELNLGMCQGWKSVHLSNDDANGWFA